MDADSSSERRVATLAPRRPGIVGRVVRAIADLARTEWLAAKSRDCAAHPAATDGLKATVCGNGKPGLKERLQEAESRLRFLRAAGMLIPPFLRISHW